MYINSLISKKKNVHVCWPLITITFKRGELLFHLLCIVIYYFHNNKCRHYHFPMSLSCWYLSKPADHLPHIQINTYSYKSHSHWRTVLVRGMNVSPPDTRPHLLMNMLFFTYIKEEIASRHNFCNRCLDSCFRYFKYVPNILDEISETWKLKNYLPRTCHKSKGV